MFADDYEPFEPRQILGKGNSGEVEKLRHKENATKVVACKTISYDDPASGHGVGSSSSSNTKEAAIREIEILKKLKHENIVEYEHATFDEANHRVLLYMEFCAGGSAQEIIRKIKERNSSDQLPHYAAEPLIWNILQQLASALMYCHQRVASTSTKLVDITMLDDTTKNFQILHRDIKPANVFLAKELQDDQSNAIAKLGDFGLGAILEDGKPPETYVGTKHYLPPEINRSARDKIQWADSCDIFSLGCTIYHLCNLEVPFGYQMDAEKAKAEKERKEAREKFDSTPYSQDLKEITSQCMAFEPDSRPTAIDVYKKAEEQLKAWDPSREKKELKAYRTGLLPNTPIAATNWEEWHYRVYFQEASGGIRESRHDKGKWTGGDSKSVILNYKAKLYSPLAVVNSGEGTEIHLFSITDKHSTDKYILQEHVYSNGSWRPGLLNKLAVQTSEYSKISAVQLSSGIRVYFQDENNDIQEYVYEPPKGPSDQALKSMSCMPLRQLFKKKKTGGKWKKGDTLQADAIQGTSLAAATWGGESIRLYYQDSGLELREHCHDGGSGWYVGHMAVGSVPKHTPISAFAWSGQNGGINIRIYWHDADKQLVEIAWVGGWRGPRQLVYMGNSHLSAVQSGGGQNIRAYYQGSDRRILEKCETNGGPWYNGSRVDAPESNGGDKKS